MNEKLKLGNKISVYVCVWQGGATEINTILNKNGHRTYYQELYGILNLAH